jgi:peptidylprolyl isomerase
MNNIKILSLSVFAVLCSGILYGQKAPVKKGQVSQKAAATTHDTVTTKSGLKYTITKKNPKGRKAMNGDRINAHYTGILTNGKRFDSSRDGGQPFSFILGNHEVINGWDEGFLYLREGEKATFIIPPALGYGGQDMGNIPPNSTLVFEVELVRVDKPIAYTPYDKKGKDTIVLKTGLKYIVIDKGNPAKRAVAGDTASIYYAGYLMNGVKFDGNFDRFEPFVLSVTGAPVIQGWQQMLPLMNKGMKVRVIIPAYLGYGPSGYPGVIPPDATLIFDMYLADLN